MTKQLLNQIKQLIEPILPENRDYTQRCEYCGHEGKDFKADYDQCSICSKCSSSAYHSFPYIIDTDDTLKKIWEMLGD